MNCRTFAGLLALASLLLGVVPARAEWRRMVDRVNARICGTLVDFTQNNGCDRRIFSPALCECRDMYVYLPPGYDPHGRYPLIIWLHSYTDDECEFARSVAPILDAAVMSGELPPLIVAAPDGSLSGDWHNLSLGSWYVNSERGRFADYIVDDVLGFMEQNFAVCPDRSARVLAGFSMGGFGAYSIGLKHPDKFKIIGGIAPALNLRHCGPCDDYRANFVPGESYLRDSYRAREVIGEFYGGLMKVRAWMIIAPVFGRGYGAIARVSETNPIELLDRLNVAPGVQDFYAGYARDDELNIDAQVESFVHAAAERGIHVESRSYECGDHSIPFMQRALPDFFAWLKDRLNCSGDNPSNLSLYTPRFDAVLNTSSRPDVAGREALLILPEPIPPEE
jgi:S-formylglutathione hydrolase FrmB